jgi:hypothetical protein
LSSFPGSGFPGFCGFLLLEGRKAVAKEFRHEGLESLAFTYRANFEFPQQILRQIQREFHDASFPAFQLAVNPSSRGISSPANMIMND